MSNRILTETPSMAKVIKDAIESRLAEVHISLPAKIVSYDGSKASVQPLLRRKYFRDSGPVDLPVITNVPVIWPQTADSVVILPLKKDDTGTLLFAERSLDRWLVSGGTVNPEDPRKFSISDAQFFPGLKPFNTASDYDATRIVIRNGNGKIVIGDGKVAIGNRAGDELLQLVSDLMAEVSATEAAIQILTVPTLVGPSGPPINAASFAAIQANVDALKSKLDAIKDVLA